MSQETTTQENVQENVQGEVNQQEAQQTPVFEEIETIDEKAALNVLVQAANLAQSTGRLSVRDSVLLAKAIDKLLPGTI